MPANWGEFFNQNKKQVDTNSRLGYRRRYIVVHPSLHDLNNLMNQFCYGENNGHQDNEKDQKH